VCNRHHSIDQQLCLWLLRNLDRMSTSVLVTTQEQIANVMGVRREGITKATAKLESAGLIERARGHITVLDRNGIEDRACECYSVVRKEYERLFPYIAAA
jgi:Mn-dependent DtxR family transcriptional regulator